MPSVQTSERETGVQSTLLEQTLLVLENISHSRFWENITTRLCSDTFSIVPFLRDSAFWSAVNEGRLYPFVTEDLLYFHTVMPSLAFWSAQHLTEIHHEDQFQLVFGCCYCNAEIPFAGILLASFSRRLTRLLCFGKVRLKDSAATTAASMSWKLNRSCGTASLTGWWTSEFAALPCNLQHIEFEIQALAHTCTSFDVFTLI